MRLKSATTSFGSPVVIAGWVRPTGKEPFLSTLQFEQGGLGRKAETVQEPRAHAITRSITIFIGIISLGCPLHISQTAMDDALAVITTTTCIAIACVAFPTVFNDRTEAPPARLSNVPGATAAIHDVWRRRIPPRRLRAIRHLELRALPAVSYGLAPSERGKGSDQIERQGQDDNDRNLFHPRPSINILSRLFANCQANLLGVA